MNHEELSARLRRFAARVGKVIDALPDTRLGRHVAGQLVRCGTSATPNHDEGSAAESKADFAHKLNVALKELVETRGWLRFIIIPELLPAKRIEEVLEECDQLWTRAQPSAVGTRCRASVTRPWTLNHFQHGFREGGHGRERFVVVVRVGRFWRMRYFCVRSDVTDACLRRGFGRQAYGSASLPQ